MDQLEGFRDRAKKREVTLTTCEIKRLNQLHSMQWQTFEHSSEPPSDE